MIVSTDKCENCSGTLSYDGVKELYECEYCHSQFRAVLSESKTEMHLLEEIDSQEILETYFCDSCGAEIMTDALTIATECMYCKSPVRLKDDSKKSKVPQKIIPFSISKDEALSIATKWMSKRFTIHETFKDELIQNLKSVYIPMWVSSGNADGEIEALFHHKENHRTGDYVDVNTDTRKRVYHSKIVFKNKMFEAVDKKTMKIVSEVFPYNMDGLKNYSMSELTGHYIDKQNVDYSQFETQLSTDLRKSLEEHLISQFKDLKAEALNQTLNITDVNFNWTYVLLPAWISIVRSSDKAIHKYFIVNGQTGEHNGRYTRNRTRSMLVFILVFGILFVLIQVFMKVGPY